MDAEKGSNGSETPSKNPMEFLRESIVELKKVHHPTRAETIQATLVTLFIMFTVSICLFVLDVVFKTLMHSLM